MENEQWHRAMKEWADEIRSKQAKYLQEQNGLKLTDEERKLANDISEFQKKLRFQTIIDDLKAAIKSNRPAILNWLNGES